MSNPDPSKIIFSSRYKYFLNYDNQTGSVTIPATSIAAGHYTTGTISIPISNNQDFSQVQINYSSDGTKWYSFPIADVVLDANFTITTVGSYGSSNLTLTFYVVNQTGSTHTSTAVTIQAHPYLFVEPS